MNQHDQRIAAAVVDAVTAAVADAMREELNELRAEIAHVKLEISQLAKRGPAGAPASHNAPIPFPKAQAALPRRPPADAKRILLPESRRVRSG